MAKEPKFNCIEKWVKKNPPKKFYEFPNQKDNRSYCVMWNNDLKTFWTFWPDFQWTKTVDGVRIEKGEWECDGDEGFIVISEIGKIWKTSDRNWKPYEGNTEENTSQTTPTTGIDPKLSCVKRHYDNKGREVTINSNGSLVVRTQTPSKVWVFSKNYYWNQYNTELKKKEFEGKWECTGDSSFRIISNDNQEWLSSDSIGWTDIAEPTTEPPTDPSTEPPTDPSTGGGGFTWKDVNLTIDDLKSGKTVSMGMRGSIVGEIQKLLIGKGYKEVSKSGQPDNMFGRMTKAQVEKFQLENKDDKGNQLKKDGIVGPKTINALLAPPPAPNTRGLERAVKSYLPTGVSPEL
jgi:hypothetical protein